MHESLKDISLETFLPQVKTIKQWSDRKKTVLKPLFPSYVFVNVKSSIEFYKALSVHGACVYIRFGKEYARIPDDEIDKIRLLLNSEDISDFETNVELLKVGDIKKICYGTLSGLDCEVIKVNNVNKIVVRIGSLQQNITATLSTNYFKEAL
ncbi:UpxY family transcription antiterminator [Flavobacterium sp. '19STA2R22 D10 B1']|uniref:UpxY family transcription antiterminator n=1 Tax=Flavobacterium aerium TaxID=3037261 RepID=UPI003557BD47